MLNSLPPFNTPAVDKDNDNALTQPYRSYFNDLYLLDIIQGHGSPEGVIEAIVGQQYMDLDGSSGNILYIKRDSDIGGDTKQGWFLS